MMEKLRDVKDVLTLCDILMRMLLNSLIKWQFQKCKIYTTHLKKKILGHGEKG